MFLVIPYNFPCDFLRIYFQKSIISDLININLLKMTLEWMNGASVERNHTF